MENIKETLRVAIEHYENDRMAFAIPKFLDLAEQHCEEAFLYLSLIYRHGDGVKKDELKAARYKKMWGQQIEALAGTGLVDYQLRLAYMLQFGDGLAVDEKRAIKIFLELANNQCAEAQFHLSTIYAHGFCGQNKNSNLELYWLDKATNLEWPKAIYYTALFLEDEDTEGSLEKTGKRYKLMQRAAELGCWQAKQYLLENQ